MTRNIVVIMVTWCEDMGSVDLVPLHRQADVCCLHVSTQRQHHLAAKRESVLRSLQGLLKAGGSQ